MAENKPVGIGIRKIKQFAFAINEKLYRGDDSLMNIDYQQGIEVVSESELLIMNFRVIFRYNDNPDELILDSHVVTFFHIKDLKEYMTEKGEIVLAENIWSTLIGLCISHSRALIANTTAGTALQNFILPMTNPVAVAKGFLAHEGQTIAKVQKI